MTDHRRVDTEGEAPDEVKAALALLREHYRQPVMPINDYCQALYTWMDCIVALNQGDPVVVKYKLPDGTEHEYTPGRQGEAYHHLLGRIRTDINKSNLLWRLLYAGQELATEACPEHKGRWSGCKFEACPHGCSFGLDVTGWIQAEPGNSALGVATVTDGVVTSLTTRAKPAKKKRRA